MNSKQTKKVKLPEEESNGNKNKERDPKDESSSTPDRVEENNNVPNTSRGQKKFSSMTRKKKQSLGCRKRLTSTKGKCKLPNKQLKSKKTTRSKLSRRSLRPYLRLPDLI